jgi:hypothetical protein
VALGLKAMFHPEAAQGLCLTFEVPVRDFVVQGRIEDGTLTVPADPTETPDLSIHGDPATMMDLFNRRESPSSALASQRIEIKGSLDDAERFFQIFHLN